MPKIPKLAMKMDELNVNWLRSLRLIKAMNKGDEDARKEYESLDGVRMKKMTRAEQRKIREEFWK